jgi:lysine 2,3-aminomutase
MNPDDPNDPIRKQVIPSAKEGHVCDEDMEDSLGEDETTPVPGLIHRYPDRCLVMVTQTCASYCRFCTRNRTVSESMRVPCNCDQAIEYISNTIAIRDVLLSGGDPLVLGDDTLDQLLCRIRAIQHVKVVRIGTRVPIFLPQRITSKLCAMLARHELWINIHVNHPRELTSESTRAIRDLANAGIPLGSQTVLLAGINDCVNVVKELMYQAETFPYVDSFPTSQP